LIPELTVMGIWGIPVVGFALLVGVIFRIAVNYDPRVSSPQKHAGWVAGGFLCHLLLWSSFDLVFLDRSSDAKVVGAFFGAFVLLMALCIAENLWVCSQTHGGVYPTFFEIRRVFFFISSIVYAIGYLANREAMITVTKPIVIFFAYGNIVHFAAIYAGILHPQEVFASNGTIAERLKIWIRSKTRPGELFSTVQTLLTTLFFSWLVLEAFCDVPARFSLVSKGIFAALAAISFYYASLYDPREPPETSKLVKLVRRVLAVSAHFAIAAYYEWYVQNKSLSHFVVLITMIILRYFLTFWLMTGEMSPEIFHQKLIMISFHLGMYTISATFFLVLNMANISTILQTVALTFCNVWYYYNTIYVIAVLAGKYRDKVIQTPPVQVQLVVIVELLEIQNTEQPATASV
jgi:hypothetical protein